MTSENIIANALADAAQGGEEGNVYNSICESEKSFF
jgi:hypothetical protein